MLSFGVHPNQRGCGLISSIFFTNISNKILQEIVQLYWIRTARNSAAIKLEESNTDTETTEKQQFLVNIMHKIRFWDNPILSSTVVDFLNTNDKANQDAKQFIRLACVSEQSITGATVAQNSLLMQVKRRVPDIRDLPQSTVMLARLVYSALLRSDGRGELKGAKH